LEKSSRKVTDGKHVGLEGLYWDFNCFEGRSLNVGMEVYRSLIPPLTVALLGELVADS